MRRSPRLWIALIAVLQATAAAAQPLPYKIDPNHSVVGFSVRHIFSKVPGRFKEFEGTILLDDKNLAASSVEVTIQATSIDTENERRDGHLRSPDFFAADSFKTLTFKSTKVVPGPNNTMLVTGDLTIRGVTKSVTLEAAFLGSGEFTMGPQNKRRVAGFEAKTTINRKDFGIVFNRVLDHGGAMLGDDVAIDLQLETNYQDPAAATPAAAPAAPEKK